MTTPILGLDELENSQSQPHVPLNAATRALEQYSQLLTLDKDLTSPPGSPADGDSYIVAPGASGAWSGWTYSIAYYSGGWLRIEPREGVTAYVADEDAYYKYSAGSPGSWNLWTLGSSSQPYDIGAQMAGSPTASLIMLRYPFPREVSFAAGLTNSQGVADVAATAQADFDILRNGVSVGTMRFAAAATTATFIAAAPTVYDPGDVLTVEAPASPDATLANISFVLAGTR